MSRQRSCKSTGIPGRAGKGGKREESEIVKDMLSLYSGDLQPL